jgi:hypothetical protein
VQDATAADSLRWVPLFSELPEDKLAWISNHRQEVRLAAERPVQATPGGDSW